MIDRQYLGVMLHLAEVPEELRKARTASANDRHISWRRSVERSSARAARSSTSPTTKRADETPGAVLRPAISPDPAPHCQLNEPLASRRRVKQRPAARQNCSRFGEGLIPA
jgi:hypothetical protein